MNATVEKDESHQDVVHVALVAGKEDKGDASLRGEGRRERERERGRREREETRRREND